MEDGKEVRKLGKNGVGERQSNLKRRSTHYEEVLQVVTYTGVMYDTGTMTCDI